MLTENKKTMYFPSSFYLSLPFFQKNVAWNSSHEHNQLKDSLMTELILYCFP